MFILAMLAVVADTVAPKPTKSKPPYGLRALSPPSHIRKLIHVFWLVGVNERDVSARNSGGAGVEAFLLGGTPPPRPRGAFFSFPLTSYFTFSLPFDELSEMDADPLNDVLGLWIALRSADWSELIAVKPGLLPLPFVELVREVPRLASLEMVSCLEGSPLSRTPGLGAGCQPAKAS